MFARSYPGTQVHVVPPLGIYACIAGGMVIVVKKWGKPERHPMHIHTPGRRVEYPQVPAQPGGATPHVVVPP